MSHEIQIERRTKVERRKSDRRKQNLPVATERRQAARRKVPRRRQIDPTTCERDYSNDEIEFMHALDAYKRTSGRMFPTCSEILEVIRALGYVKMSPETISIEVAGADEDEQPECGEMEMDSIETDDAEHDVE